MMPLPPHGLLDCPPRSTLNIGSTTGRPLSRAVASLRAGEAGGQSFEEGEVCAVVRQRGDDPPDTPESIRRSQLLVGAQPTPINSSSEEQGCGWLKGSIRVGCQRPNMAVEEEIDMDEKRVRP